MRKPIVEYILDKIKEEKERTGIHWTLFAACSNSISVIKAALISAKRCNSPIKFAITLNQVDSDGGYTGMNQFEFVKIILRVEGIVLSKIERSMDKYFYNFNLVGFNSQI